MAATAFLIALEDEGIDEQGREQTCAEPLEPCACGMAFLRGNKCRSEPFARQQIVDAETEEDGTRDDAGEIGDEGACAELLADDEDARHVGGGTCHEQHKSGTRCESFEHECDGDGDATRCANVHGDADAEDEQHGQRRVVLENGKPVVGHKDRNQCSNDEADDKPLADVLHHVNVGVAEG